MRKIFDRNTGEILIILVGLTVCGYVLVSTIVALLLIFFTDRDVSDAVRNISDIINTLIGLLAGYLAGRTDSAIRKNEQNNKSDPEAPE